MQMFVDQEKLDAVRSLYTKKIPRSFYIHALSVDDSVKGRGGGKALIDIAKEIAVDEGLDNLSLHVWRDNEPARILYQKTGFQEVEDIPMTRHDLLPHDGGMILLKMDIE
nr:GNAT family N-acetyltransferase [Sneathiella limimaris]